MQGGHDRVYARAAGVALGTSPRVDLQIEHRVAAVPTLLLVLAMQLEGGAVDAVVRGGAFPAEVQQPV